MKPSEVISHVISIGTTIFVIGYSIANCLNGQTPTWLLFFIGWAFVLIADINAASRSIKK